MPTKFGGCSGRAGASFSEGRRLGVYGPLKDLSLISFLQIVPLKRCYCCKNNVT